MRARSYAYRLSVTKAQSRRLEEILDQQRWLYNEALSLRQMAWEQYRASISFYDCCRWLTGLRKEKPDFTELPVSLQRGTIRRLDQAYAFFFRRCKLGQKPGYPRFKSRDRFDSITFDEFSGVRVFANKLVFKGCPPLTVRFHRQLPEAKITGCTLRRDQKGWSVTFRLTLPDVPKVAVKQRVGLDMGLTHLVTLSTGEKISNPRHTKRYASVLRLKQRALSRCQRGSNRRRKIKRSLSRFHAKIANSRATYCHQVSVDLVRRFDYLAAEDLSVANMTRGRLSKFIQDAAWATLLHQMAYKAEDAGKTFELKDPRGTTKECSRCGESRDMPLHIRVYKCEKCGFTGCRDVNASLVIRDRPVVRPKPRNVAHKGKRAVGVSSS